MRRTRKDKSVLSCLLRKEKHGEYKSDYRTGRRRAGEVRARRKKGRVRREGDGSKYVRREGGKRHK